MSEEKVNPAVSPTPTQKEKKGSPAKSPATPKITNSQKEKNPRKVAAGKKLGAISKMAKSQKKYKAENHDARDEEPPPQGIPKLYVGLGVCAVVGVLGLIYLTKKSDLPEKQGEREQNPQKAKSNLISLD